jgi:sporulation protein YlmC with PRC-barrel domain
MAVPKSLHGQGEIQMIRKILTATLASAAIALAAPALAGPGGGGGGGGGGAGHGGGVGGGMDNAGMGGPSQTGIDARAGSMGPENASPTGIDHSSPNSVLHDSTSTGGSTTTTTTTQPDTRGLPGTNTTTTVASGTLSGLTAGTTLYSNGTAVGTVQQIRTNANGTATVVVVKGSDGGFYAVPVNKLSWANGTLSTTARLAGVNGSGSAQGRANSQGPYHASATGIAHANSHSVLATAAGGLALSGITSGTAVYNSSGTEVGTVSRVFTTRSGTISKLRVRGTNGRLYTYSSGAFSMNGTNLTTSAPIQ